MADPAAPDDPLARLAGELGLELPVFEGPLDAFQIGEDSGVGVPVYLGGDLHAIPPECADRRSGAGRDHSLDGASITVADDEQDAFGTTAVQGIWCLAVPADLFRSAPYFAIRDARGRLRIWLLLPPAHAMIGIAHLWLPALPPLPGSS